MFRSTTIWFHTFERKKRAKTRTMPTATRIFEAKGKKRVYTIVSSFGRKTSIKQGYI